MNIIVIDENLSRRKIIHRKLQLTKIPSQIVLVKNIREAFIYIKNINVDIVLINQQLFNLLTKEQKEVLNKYKCIILTLKKEVKKLNDVKIYFDADLKEFKELLSNLKLEKVKIRLLSKREKEILFLISHGLNNKKLAHKLKIQDATIKTHLRRIRIKLKTANRTHSVAKALRQGYIS